MCGLRRLLGYDNTSRAGGANRSRENRVCKTALLTKIQELDLFADVGSLDAEGWAFRYSLEDQLTRLFELEEEYWRQRGRVDWTLRGDANTAYFHAIANGRRRKCLITSLNTDGGTIVEKEEIQAHIYQFYRDLLGTEKPKLISTSMHLWNNTQQVNA
jgi:hypothetical protein